MPSIERELSKDRSPRFSLNYHKTPNRIVRWRGYLIGLATLGAVGWLASAYALPEGGVERYSRGPVANVHAAWDQKCKACHDPFQPINSNTWFQETLFGKSTDWKREASDRCETCHAGPAHAANQKAESVAACGSCHRDHRGRENSLVRVSDLDCTTCHGGLDAHVTGDYVYAKDMPADVKKITSFAYDHPDFRPEIGPIKKPEDRRLKFSHKQHMTTGMGLARDSARGWKITDVPKEFRERYVADDKGMVQLRCADCHRLDSSDTHLTRAEITPPDPWGALNPSRRSGAYFLPIVFDAHCKACHATEVQTSENWPKVATPHRAQPKEMNDYLWRTYVDLTVKADPAMRDSILSKTDAVEKALRNRTRLDPAVSDPDDTAAAKALTQEVNRLRGLVDANVLKAERLLYIGTAACGKCHDFKPAAANADPQRRFVPQEVLATNTPDVWFPHAKFSHVSHRAMDCRACHKDYYADGVGGSATVDEFMKANGGKLEEKASVAIVDNGIKNCRECHAPATTSADGHARGGVRHDCVECHSYHHGGTPLAGKGAAARAPSPHQVSKYTLDAFLDGTLENVKGPAEKPAAEAKPEAEAK
jgi:hypothetical protein